ncbi:tRNA dihydrouridine synthase DusB [bacterium]|nr:MAG: tRNA dihydrouridine synthase DusB [bacterium]
MLKIGSLKLKSNLILAPMSGITDYPFRMLCRKFGCELAFIEMINVRALGYNSRKTQEMLFTDKIDRPLGVQILGCEEKFLLRAADILKKHSFDIVDFNAACPAKKVVRRGEGASLLKEPKKLNRLLKLVVENFGVPVTVKIRTGWDKNSINPVEVALYAQDAGVKTVFIHGRTREQFYSGKVDYGAIRKVKKALNIPVIASGDILSVGLAEKMFAETGCDGILIARGSLGNPWIFKEIEASLKDGRLLKKPDGRLITEMMSGHLSSYVDFYGERNGVMLFRKFFSWYTKGFRKIRPLREKSSRAKTKAAMEEIIKECAGAKAIDSQAVVC